MYLNHSNGVTPENERVTTYELELKRHAEKNMPQKGMISISQVGSKLFSPPDRYELLFPVAKLFFY